MKKTTTRFLEKLQQVTPQVAPAKPRRARRLKTLGGVAELQPEVKLPFHQVHPKNWWTGMKNPFLQVMIHERGVKNCLVQLEDLEQHPLDEATSGIKLLGVEFVENENYVFINLDLAQAHPQTFCFHLYREDGSLDLRKHYTLTEKNHERENRPSFTSADVLYLLMPDRFIDVREFDAQAAEYELSEEQKELGEMIEKVTGKYYRTENMDDKSAGRHGGNLAGIDYAVQQGYFDDLGITAIWPTPVQVNNGICSYHGYAITDYYEIDPRFGNMQGYKQLVAHCHKHGLKMVMDMVFNHCGKNHFLLLDLPDKTWFNYDSEYKVNSSFHTDASIDPYVSKHDYKVFNEGWFNDGMPDLNQRNPLVKNYLIQNSIWWIEEGDIDGIRQDTFPYIDQEMARDWCVAVREEYPNFNIVGETWLKTAVGNACLQKDSPIAGFNTELPTIMDFELRNILNEVLVPGICETDQWGAGLGRLYNYLTADRVYANPDNLLTFLGNHDLSRFYKNEDDAKDHKLEYKCAITLLLTLRGIPQLYFGDEIGMSGSRNGHDGEFRTDFGTGTVNVLNPSDANNKEKLEMASYFFNITSSLLKWRKTCPAAHHGKMTQFTIDDAEKCYIFGRSIRDTEGNVTSGFVVIVNGSDHPKKVNLLNSRYRELVPEGALSAKGVLTGRVRDLTKDITLDGRDCIVLDFGCE